MSTRRRWKRFARARGISSTWISPHRYRAAWSWENQEAAKQSGAGKGSFVPTNDFSRLRDMDCVIICVPTPLTKYREPDLSYVMNTTRTIARYLRKGQLVVLESTTYPGTTDQDMRTVLEETGLKAGKDFFLAFSPEREDPNNKDYRTGTIPKVVGGFTKKCLKAAVPFTTPSSSKRSRLLDARRRGDKAHREHLPQRQHSPRQRAQGCLRQDGHRHLETIDAAKTKPFGFQALPRPRPGRPLHPIDPSTSPGKAREYAFHPLHRTRRRDQYRDARLCHLQGYHGA